MDRIQFQIKARKGDETFIERVFVEAATQFELVDTKIASLVEHTICNYSGGLGFGFGLGSCWTGDLILVDFNPGKGRTEQFTAVFDSISSQLQNYFGDRISLADTKSYITVQNTLPISEEMRAFHKKLLESRSDR